MDSLQSDRHDCLVLKGPILSKQSTAIQGKLQVFADLGVATFVHASGSTNINLDDIHGILQRKSVPAEAKLLLTEAKAGLGHVLRFLSASGEPSAEVKKRAVQQLQRATVAAKSPDKLAKQTKLKWRQAALRSSSVLRQEFEQYVQTGLVSEESFWSRRQGLLHLHGLQESSSKGTVLPSQPPDSRVDQVRERQEYIRMPATKEAQIFYQEPVTRMAYAKFVRGLAVVDSAAASRSVEPVRVPGDKIPLLSKDTFWTRYMRARQDNGKHIGIKTKGIVEAQMIGQGALAASAGGKSATVSASSLQELLRDPDRFFRGLRDGVVDAWLRNNSKQHGLDQMQRRGPLVSGLTPSRAMKATSIQRRETDLTSSAEESLSGDFRHRSGFGTGETARLYAPDDVRSAGKAYESNARSAAVRVIARDTEAEGVFDSLNRYGAAVLQDTERSVDIATFANSARSNLVDSEGLEDLVSAVEQEVLGPGQSNGKGQEWGPSHSRMGPTDFLSGASHDLTLRVRAHIFGSSSSSSSSSSSRKRQVARSERKNIDWVAQLGDSKTASITAQALHGAARFDSVSAAGGGKEGVGGTDMRIDACGLPVMIPAAYRKWCVDSAAANAELMAAAWVTLLHTGGVSALDPEIQRIGEQLMTRHTLLQQALDGMDQQYVAAFAPAVQDLLVPMKACIAAWQEAGLLRAAAET